MFDLVTIYSAATVMDIIDDMMVVVLLLLLLHIVLITNSIYVHVIVDDITSLILVTM